MKEPPDNLALVVSFCALFEIPSPSRLLDWRPLRGSFTHPLYGGTHVGITDGVLAHCVFARGVAHVTLGQMTPVEKPGAGYSGPRKQAASPRKKKPRVDMNVDDLY